MADLSPNGYSFEETPLLDRDLYDQAEGAIHKSDQLEFWFENDLTVQLERQLRGWDAMLQIRVNGNMMYSGIPADENIVELWADLQQKAYKLEQEAWNEQQNETIEAVENLYESVQS